MADKFKKSIKVVKANLHNLKNVSIEIPRNQFTVITGVSGSGKSSLAFDTIYSEGQRRFVESLSSYARQFLERMQKPDAESITGLPPAVAIEQDQPKKNPRSTVGTSTEIYDYIRLLYGRIGKTYCRETGNQVEKDSPATIMKKVMSYDEKDKIYILFPFPEDSFKISDEIEKFREFGYFRIVPKHSNEIINLDTDEIPKDANCENMYILADRLVFKNDDDTLTRLNESIETAFKFGMERVLVRNLTKSTDERFSGAYEDTDSGILYLEPEPKLFSFNNPYGACPHCQGFGRTVGIDESLVIPDTSLSISKEAIMPFRGEKLSKHRKDLEIIAPEYGIDINAPIRELNDEQMEIIWEGARGYKGINGFFKVLEEKSYKMHYRIMLNKYRGYTTCKACGGSRIRTSARQVYINGKNIPEIINMPLEKLRDFMKTLNLSDYEQQVVGQVLEEIIWRLGLLIDIGLEYLTLNRLNHTLSGGESQRINLSTALGSALTGTLYVLDEPSIGMHPRDTQRLLNILYKLRNLGNTIIVVEHDLDIINKADFVIDMGPLAGEKGGEIMFAGNTTSLKKSAKSLTGLYLSGRKKIELPDRDKFEKELKLIQDYLIIEKPRANNLKIDSVKFPVGKITVVTGVSGSGKSTLVQDVLYSGMRKRFGNFPDYAGKYDEIKGAALFSYLQMVDQSPIGRSARSTPATYTKVFDKIRDLFSGTQLAKQLGIKPGYFSFNVPGGRCEECEGEGYTKVDMQFLPDVTLECESCKGTRYSKEAREILYNDKSIVDILNMTIDEAADFFESVPKVKNKLDVLKEVGLGYLQLGQPSTMLSGGESQRIKLAGHLSSDLKGNTLFIFDEPTTGLHLEDISKLLKAFLRLRKEGHTIIIIEHNLHVMSFADHIIDLGPEAGEFGGEIVAEGSPEYVANNYDTHTARALKEFLDKD